jgi:predicted nucleotidyltransferase
LFSVLSTIVLTMENNKPILDSLFKSKLRQRLLALFLTNPHDRYYARQLHAMIDGSVGSLHRELIHLENLGILNSEKVGNLKFYFANREHPLFFEISGITAKTVGVFGALRAVVKELENIDVAFVYGSFASGKETARSDIDLFIIGDVNHGALNKALSEVEKTLQREINYTAMTNDEFRSARRSGAPFTQNVMAEPKVFILGGEDELKGLD